MIKKKLLWMVGMGILFTSLECRGDFLSEFKSLCTFTPGKVWIEKVRFDVADDMNGDAPVTVVLVVIYDDGLNKKICALTADDFFKKISKIKAEAGSKVEFHQWELVPGRHFPDQKIPLRSGAEGAVFFAHYNSPGNHNFALSDERGAVVHLQKDEMMVVKDDEFEVVEEEKPS